MKIYGKKWVGPFRNISGVIAAVAVIALNYNGVRAGGFETKGLGSRVLGMGSAAIGLADDWSSIYWNPAGLAFLEGAAINLEVQTLTTEQQSSSSLRNVGSFLEFDYLMGDFVKFSPTREYEPDRFKNTSLRAFIPTPDLGWYANYGWYTIASGLYATSGGGVSWNDKMTGFREEAPGDSMEGNIDLGFFSLNVPFAFAMKVSDKFSVGINASLVMGYNTRDVSKTYLGENGDRYYFQNQSDSIGLGYSVDLGVLYKATPNYSVGAIVRLPSNVWASGNSRFEIPEQQCEGDTCSWNPYVEEAKSNVVTVQPLKVGMGIGARPTPTLKVALDLYWLQYSEFKTTSTYDLAPDQTLKYLADTDLDWGFEDRLMVRAGAEYSLGREQNLRLGFIYDPSPFRSDRAALATPRFTDAYIATTGYGLYGKQWSMDLAYQFVYSPERLSTVSTPDGQGGEFQEDLAITAVGHVATMTVGYSY